MNVLSINVTFFALIPAYQPASSTSHRLKSHNIKFPGAQEHHLHFVWVGAHTVYTEVGQYRLCYTECLSLCADTQWKTVPKLKVLVNSNYPSSFLGHKRIFVA